MIRWVVGVALAAVAAYLAVTFVQVWAASRQDDRPKADAVVVLGAAQYNGRPSPVLTARLEHALALYKAGVAPRIVVTGGRQPGDRYTEATAGYEWLRARDVPDQAILKEVQGRTTYQSLAAVDVVLDRQKLQKVVLVSDDYHALRLRGIASEVGLQAVVSPVKTERSTFSRLRSLGRETVAVAAGRIFGYRRLTRLVG